MLVYGDCSRWTAIGDKLFRISRSLDDLSPNPGICAHAILVRAFIEAAELAQGLVDVEFTRNRVDAYPRTEQLAATLLDLLAIEIERSWESGFGAEVQIDPIREWIAALESQLVLTSTIRCNVAEGYAHYALYPEAYLMAGRGLGRETQFLGIRSIG